MKINQFLNAESAIWILSIHRGSLWVMLQFDACLFGVLAGSENKMAKLFCDKFCTSVILSAHFKGSVGVYFSVEVCLSISCCTCAACGLNNSDRLVVTFGIDELK